MIFLKLFFSILSTFIIFYYTNLAKPIKSNIDDGNYLNNNSFLGNLINHKPGYVCPLGVILGKLLLFISFIQVYYIYNNKYSSIRFMNLVLLILGYIVSFMNKKLQSNIFTAFILQLFVIILPDKKLKN